MVTRFFKMKLVSMVIAILVGCSILGCDDQKLDPTKPGLLVPKTVDQDATLPQLFINGTNLHVETYGNQNDPIIIILHSGPGGDYRNLLNCKKFAEQGFFVIFFDQRGSGLSQRHPQEALSLQLLIEDLDAIIRHYQNSTDQKVFFIGQSWGAMLATAYVNEYPTKISGLVLCEPGGFTWPDAKAFISRARELNPLSERINDAFYFDQILTGKENEHEILDYKMTLSSAFDYSEGNALGHSGPSPFWRNGATMQAAFFNIASHDGFDFRQNLKEFTTKVLFLYSDLDKAYGFQHAQLVSSAYPNVELTLIKGSGHEIPYFGWQNFYPIALQYLTELK